jgi:putative DNA primase/helicase
MFLLTNYKPQANAGDYALWTRLHLIPFTLSFVNNPQRDNERKANPHLLNELKNEASGILAWLVRGCLSWQQRGLDPPSSVLAATEEYQKEEDLIGQFIDERIMEQRGTLTKLNDIYTEYKKWSEEGGHFIESIKRFGQYLVNKGYKKRKISKIVHVEHIKIKDEA